MVIGKEFKVNRDSKGKFAVKVPAIKKVAFYLILVAGVFAMTNYTLERYVAWRQEWNVVYKFPVEVRTYKPVDIVKREIEWISPVVEVIEQSDIDINNPIDQKIYDLWGDRYFLLARSIFKCESGLREDAVNWGSKDIGVAQINWPTWEKQVGEKFGYTLKGMFDYEKNLEVAYWIWDRDGDGQGSFAPWVVFQNGNFIGCVE